MRDRYVPLLVALVVLAPAGGSVVVTAQVGNGSFAVAQGTTCTVVEPVSGEENVSAFYDYRNPATDPSAGTYSSYGTEEYQETGTSALLFYEGTEGVSLTLVHGELGDEDGGSTLTMSFSGLPGGEWAVQDDQYQQRDDDWVLGGSEATIDWKWGPNRTDGGAYRGLGDLSGPVTITPGFNEDAAHWGDWGYAGSDDYRLTEWRLIGADGEETELDRDRRVFVHGGECEETPPSAELIGPNSAESGQSVTFNAGLSTDDDAIGGYEWDTDGDGEVETVTADPTLEHTFAEPGDYTVTVTAFDTYGNGDSASLDVTVTAPSTPPTAALDAPELTTVNESVRLDASDSTDEGTITAYRWDVDGDGVIEATTSDPVLGHTYTEAGTVEPAVVVVDDDGSTDTATARISVRPPNQPPNASLDAPAAVDEGSPITLDAGGSTDDRGIDRYEWDPDGDGEFETDTAAPTLEHTYDESGNVTPRVRVVDTDGEADTATATVDVRPVNDPPTAELSAPDQATVNVPVTFDASGSTDEEGIATYRWDFDGDGEFDLTTREPTAQYVYGNVSAGVVATVTVVDEGGLADSSSETLDVLPPDDPPNASLDAPANATVGEDATFDASNSTDDRGIEAYRWDFDGDGETESETDEPVVDYEYEQGGTFEVTVTVVDTGGQSASASATTRAIVPPSPPDAALDAPEEATVNRSVTLDASASSDEGTITEYRWDVDGDGVIEANTTGSAFEHTYTELGEYEPEVTVVDDDGETDSAAADIEVMEPNFAPNASLAAPERTLVGETVTLDASGSTPGGEDEVIAAYRWDFDGDGEVESETGEATVEHSFSEAGAVTVSVVVVGGDGQTATATAPIAVGDPDAAAAGIGVGTDDPTAGEPVTFEASNTTAASPIASYDWAFGDGASGSGETVEHSYGGAGEYEVTLTITTEGGVTANATRTVAVAEAEDSGGGSGGGGQGGGGGGGQGGGGGGQAGGGQGGGGQAGGGGGQDADEPEPEPDIGGANVTLGSETLLVGETLVVEATVTNRGDGAGTKTVEFEVEGSLIESREIPLGPGESRTIAFSHQFTTPGQKSVEVDHGRTRTVEVRPREPNITVAALTVDDSEVEAGQQFTLTANVTNTGAAAGERAVALELFGETVASRPVSLSPGESTSVSFTRSVMSAGSYDATVGNESVTVTVVGASGATESSPTTTTDSPGFGTLLTLLALLAFVGLLGRR